MPYRIQPGVRDEQVRRTFENIKRTLEPTLYSIRFDADFGDSIGIEEYSGPVVPIPYYFDPVDGSRKKAWVRGSLVIDHMCTGHELILTVDVVAYTEGQEGDSLSSVECTLGGTGGDALTLKRFYEEQSGLDLSAYDGIGIKYSSEEVPTMPLSFSTTLLWRPSS